MGLCALCGFSGSARDDASKLPPADVEASPAERFSALVLEGAEREVERGTPYIENYEVLDYPGGDVTPGTGVCTDLVVRAFRHAGLDLQKALHEDRKANPDAYPAHLGPDNEEIDRNIDHRRCRNLVVWFQRHAESLPTEVDDTPQGEWLPGDVVFFVRRGGAYPWHVAIVSDVAAPDLRPFVIDSYPPRTSDTRRLTGFGPIHSHFRANDRLAALAAKELANRAAP